MEFQASQTKSKSFSIATKVPINCFDLNSNGNRIIVAGRKEWELLSIGENQFYSINEISKKVMSLCIMDICWSRLEENLIVSCGSNGELHKLNVSESNLILDQTIKFHERAINKVHLHPHEPNTFISGGQDGIIKLIDFRIRSDSNPVSIFKHDAEDKVIDLKFNPSASMKYQFASGSESGHAFTWDIRNTSKYDRKFMAHLGGVHLDWHPEEKNWLATASRDRQIYVWNLSSEKSTPINTLTHSESVVSIKWRPRRRTQITACSTGLETHLYVWDFLRPYVPYLSFDSPTNKYTNFIWRNSPKIMVASTRTHLFNINTSEAIRPADHSTLVTVQMDKHGSVAFAAGIGEPKPSKNFDLESDSDNDAEKFRITKSALYFHDQVPVVRSDWFYYSATNYKFKEMSFDELCVHNANVALNFKKLDIYKDWMIFKTMYKTNDSYEHLKDLKESASTNTNLNANFVNSSNANKYSKTHDDLNVNHSKAALSEVSSAIQLSLNGLSNMNLKQTGQTSSTSNSSGLTSSSSDITSDDSVLGGSNSNLNVNSLENKNQPTPETIKTTNSLIASAYDSNNVVYSNNLYKLTNLNANATPGANLGYNQNYLTGNSHHHHLHQSHNHHQESTHDYNLDTQINNNINEDEMNNPNNFNKFDDDEDNFLLPSDIIEYNDDVNEYLMNEKVLFNIGEPFDQHFNYNLSSKSYELTITGSYGAGANPGYNSTTNMTSNIINKRQTDNFESKNINQRNDNTDLHGIGLFLNSNKTTSGGSTAFVNNDNLNQEIILKAQNNILDENKLLALNSLSNTQAAAQLFEIQSDEKINFDNFFFQLLLSYINEQNDLSTAIFMYIVALQNGKIDRNKIEPQYLDEWFSQFIELLSKFELWNLRTDIIKVHPSEYMKNLTQQSIIFKSMCSKCKKTIKEGTYLCGTCKKNLFLCVYCHLPVKRLYAWCHSCFHGGHLNHLDDWFKKNNKCPSGCGCMCGNSLQLSN